MSIYSHWYSLLCVRNGQQNDCCSTNLHNRRMQSNQVRHRSTVNIQSIHLINTSKKSVCQKSGPCLQEKLSFSYWHFDILPFSQEMLEIIETSMPNDTTSSKNHSSKDLLLSIITITDLLASPYKLSFNYEKNFSAWIECHLQQPLEETVKWPT